MLELDKQVNASLVDPAFKIPHTSLPAVLVSRAAPSPAERKNRNHHKQFS
jgi:hypothetical protein